MLRRLAARFANGGFLHTGQGKWYPGEPLPRWALGIWWRTDGKPLWRNPALLADARAAGTADIPDARRFACRLAERLGLDAALVITAFEDMPALLVAEAALPVNVDPLEADLTRQDERARLARLLQRGLDRPAGFVLPLRAIATEGSVVPSWRSSPWPLKRERLYAVPADSPLGTRLPLASLPDVMPGEVELDPPVDPFAPRGDLPDPAALAPHRERLASGSAAVAPKDVVKTALCVEVRGGHLCVFMPPLTRLDDYVALLAAIEDVAAECATPVVVEGYPPPRDPRVRVLNGHARSGGDRGQHPSGRIVATNWSPRSTRCTRRRGSRGCRPRSSGSTAAIPAPAAAITSRWAERRASDSPLLRRPDLLQSLITYWQNHPALSYLFSGIFIGPTSQAPRVDEARDDRLYELEIAFQQLDRQRSTGDGSSGPWLVDRLLRHLLTDLTGNTHRAEFSIDKLYSPDSADRPARTARIPRLRDAAALRG